MAEEDVWRCILHVPVNTSMTVDDENSFPSPFACKICAQIKKNGRRIRLASGWPLQGLILDQENPLRDLFKSKLDE